MTFDPKAYLAKKKAQTDGFDPKAYLNKKALEVSAPEGEQSELESALRGAAQSASMGFADELTGAGEAAKDFTVGDIPRTFEDLTQAYKQHRDESRSAYKKALDTNTKSYLAGTLVGGVLPIVAAGPAGMGIQGAARMGGIAGLGTSDVDLTAPDQSLASKLENTGKDIAVGGVLGGALASIPSALGYVKNKTFPGQLFTKELSGQKVLGKDAARAIENELNRTASSAGTSIQSDITEAAKNKSAILNKLEEQGKNYNIDDLLSFLKGEKKELPISLTKARDTERLKLDEPFERLKDLKSNITEQTPASEIMSGSAENTYTPKQLDALRDTLGNLGFEQELKDSKVTALAKRLAGKASEKLNTTLNPVTGELEKNELGAVNDKLKNLIKAQEMLNVGGEAATEYGSTKALTPLISRLEQDTSGGIAARAKLKEGLDALKRANPELADKIEKQAKDVADRYLLNKEASGDITLSRTGLFRLGQLGAGYTGRALNAVDEATGGAAGMIGRGVLSPITDALTNQAGTIPTMAKPSDIANAPETQTNRLKFSDLNQQQKAELAKQLRGQKNGGVAVKVEKASNSKDPVEHAQADFVLEQTKGKRDNEE